MTEPSRPRIPLVPQEKDPLTEEEWEQVNRLVRLCTPEIPEPFRFGPFHVLLHTRDLRQLARAIQELQAAAVRGGEIQEAPKSWLCPHCHQSNAAGDWCCKVCQKPPRRYPIRGKVEKGLSPAGWLCPVCGRVCAPSVLTCPECPQGAEPVVVRASRGFGYGRGYAKEKTGKAVDDVGVQVVEGREGGGCKEGGGEAERSD